MIVHLMFVLDYLQEVKMMQSSNFDNYKEIRAGLPAYNHDNLINGKDTAKNQANGFFE